MNCETCGMQLVGDATSETETLVGYSSPPGHDHNDNCLYRIYQCDNGHWVRVYLRRRCSTPGCDWAGKETCWCHYGRKVDAWPQLGDQ